MSLQLSVKQIAGLKDALDILGTKIDEIGNTYGTKRVLAPGDNITVKSGYQYIVTKALEIPAGANFNLEAGAELVLLSDALSSIDNYTGSMTAGDMTIATLAFLPEFPEKVIVTIGGIRYTYGVDFTVSGKVITATAVLNEALGGTGTDGLGFSSDYNVQVFYTY